ncbi:hypothetical protein MF672_038995 [Actinomadura sp. ATCC 31491]|uniref:Uncharacterized protein n=1 Tax=Actinomadura luzonensis TaxID=2805427 RepID=A0ABT0G585_9ACTN|nr:hypothetical protein [Actinomadura luzonensis]MCK2219742.1 hypothetical protein [Actinomadura luzonensis]
MTDTPDEPGQVRPFAAMLQEIQGGAVADEAADLLQQLVTAVTDIGKKGHLVLTITVQPLKGNASALNVAGEVVLKAPRPEPAAGVFFFDTSGNLMRDNPRQATIPGLREVGKPNYDNVRTV